MKVLGIESSCDETAAAVVADGYMLLSNVVASSADLHVQYGGVVPEIAARSHIEVIMPVIQQALDDADCSWDDIDAIAVTYGAGLGGSLLIGVMTARTLALTYNKPLYGVNHVLAHVYANFLTATGSSPTLAHLQMKSSQPAFPTLAIIVSGKHSQLAVFADHFKYQLLGETQDDAIGEAFDKVAKMLGLPYPGGPSVAAAAEAGDPQAYAFPKAAMSGYNFSFSGVKTAVLRRAQAEIGESYAFPSSQLSQRLSEAQKHDIAASFQYTAVQTIVSKAVQAYKQFAPRSVVIAGGVAANSELRRQLSDAIAAPIDYPDFRLCTDNGAMVATLSCFHVKYGLPPADPYSLVIEPNLSM